MISLQLGLQFCLRVDLDMLSGVTRTETQHKFTTRWQCNLRIEDLAPTLSECLFADLQQFTEIKKKEESEVFLRMHLYPALYIRLLVSMKITQYAMNKWVPNIQCPLSLTAVQRIPLNFAHLQNKRVLTLQSKDQTLTAPHVNTRVAPEVVKNNNKVSVFQRRRCDTQPHCQSRQQPTLTSILV